MAFEIINPEAFGARPSGWNHGMLGPKGGRMLFVAGQIVPVGDFVTQWDGALGRVMEVVGDAPCQCFSPGGHEITSPGRITLIDPPHLCTKPQPEVTMSVWPRGCVCQLLRAQGSNVT